MPRYRVNGHVSGGKYLGVFEAETPEEAVKMALESEEAWVSLCHQCAGQCEDPQVTGADADLEEDEDAE